MYTEVAVTIIFVWDLGDTLISNYTVSISPKPISHPVTYVVLSPPLFVSLKYNVTYTAAIFATNCAGDSLSYTLNNIKYGNLITFGGRGREIRISRIQFSDSQTMYYYTYCSFVWLPIVPIINDYSQKLFGNSTTIV